MKTISTKELQQAYNNWFRYLAVIGDEPNSFWELVNINKDASEAYLVSMDAWKLSPESEAIIHMLNSPHRTALYKVWKIRHGQ